MRVVQIIEPFLKELNKSQKVADAKEKMQKRARDKVVSEKKEIEMLDEMADMQESAAFDTSILDEATFKAQFSFVQEGRGSQQDFERITESGGYDYHIVLLSMCVMDVYFNES